MSDFFFNDETCVIRRNWTIGRVNSTSLGTNLIEPRVLIHTHTHPYTPTNNKIQTLSMNLLVIHQLSIIIESLNNLVNVKNPLKIMVFQTKLQDIF